MIQLHEMSLPEYVRFVDLEIQDLTNSLQPNVKHSSKQIRYLPEPVCEVFTHADLNTDNCKFWTIFNRYDKEPVGGFFVKVNREQAYLIQFLIFEEYRNKKLGQKALVSLEDTLRSIGIYKVRLNVFYDNKPALHIYEKLNYRLNCVNKRNNEMIKDL